MAPYSVRILICLCLYSICWTAVVSVREDARNDYRGRYRQKASQYDVIVPHRVTDRGEFVSHMIPRHFKRSYYKRQKLADMGPEDAIHYMIPINGTKHYLKLFPSNEMLSPGVVVEIHDGKNINGRKISKLDNIQCHYTGSVVGEKESHAALSTCYGLSGYIRTKNGYFIIKPAAGHDPLSGNEHPHLLYQHDEDPTVINATCATTTDDLVSLLAKRMALKDEDNFPNKTINNQTCSRYSTPLPELYIEAMVVLDKSLLNYHKELDVENYVLTVFNMAHRLYHDASLGRNINLAIVRMIRLEDEEHQLNLAVNKNARKTLEYFREWQQQMNPGDDTHPNHHDVALLLTRIDICEDNENCGLLGASIIAGICEPDQQAILCEDDGLRLGFVIAHEIAHTLAIPHDTLAESGCNATLPNNLSTVMNPSVNMKTAEWSPCSGRYLQLYLDQGLGKCLFDPPTDHSFVMPDVLPGVMYGGDHQCRELLGPNAGLCDTGIECQNLICYIEDQGCVETHIPAAPGTNCGEKKWCYRGNCIEVGERPGAIDGKWGPWSTWSECSRTCGSGVSNRQRHCDSPVPAHGGKYCDGEHKNHRICNTEPCAIGQPSFRNVQCAEFDQWMYPEDNKVHTWKAYRMDEENPCILFCVNDEGEIASLLPRVVDGTKCLRGLRDICIDGICREIPCDLDLDSRAVEDWCGVCRGDGTSCKVVEGQQFVSAALLKDSKSKLVDIPPGTVNIKIEETEPTAAIIQVGNKDGKTIYINGDTYGLFNLPGCKAWLGNVRTKQEALNVPGPTTKELSIWILTRDNVTIKYSFGLQETVKRATLFSWSFLDWSQCSANCGPGNTVAIARCTEKTSGLVDDKYCNRYPKPKDRVRPCEIAPCIPRWMVGDWQKCRCPQGVRYRMVKCMKPTGEGEGESDVIANKECVNPKPKEKGACNCRARKARLIEQKRMKSKKQKRRQSFKSGEMRKRDSDTCGLNLTDTDDSENDNEVSTVKVPIQSIQIDKENPDDVTLTLHEEFEDKHQCGHKEIQLKGKEALIYLSKMENDFRNNKSRI